MRALKRAARAPPRVNPLHDITGSDTLKMPFVASLRYMASQYRNRRPHPIGIHGRVLSEQTVAHCWNRRTNSSEYAIIAPSWLPRMRGDRPWLRSSFLSAIGATPHTRGSTLVACRPSL
jgi:hypothetical protein